MEDNSPPPSPPKGRNRAPSPEPYSPISSGAGTPPPPYGDDRNSVVTLDSRLDQPLTMAPAPEWIRPIKREVENEQVETEYQEYGEMDQAGEPLPGPSMEEASKSKPGAAKYQKEKEIKKEKVFELIAKREHLAVDYAWRWNDAEVDRLLSEVPALWQKVSNGEDPLAREAVALMDKVRNCTIKTVEFSRLEALYGIYITELVRRVNKALLQDLSMLDTPDLKLYREVCQNPGALRCPQCGVQHGFPETLDNVCPPRDFNSPRPLGLIGVAWKAKAKAICIGLRRMKSQPPKCRDSIYNLSPIREDLSYNPKMDMEAPVEVVEKQGLYQTLLRRVELVKDEPKLVILVEYLPPRDAQVEPGVIPTSWGPFRIIQVLQKLAHNFLVLLGPPIEYTYAMTEAQMAAIKKNWLSSTRELATMATAMGVPFYPMATHLILQPDGTTLKQCHFKAEYTHNKFLEPAREQHRRATVALDTLVDSLAPALLSKEEWMHAIEEAE